MPLVQLVGLGSATLCKTLLDASPNQATNLPLDRYPRCCITSEFFKQIIKESSRSGSTTAFQGHREQTDKQRLGMRMGQ